MDELDKLRAAICEATPAPEETSKEAALRVTEENYANLQGLVSAARPTDTSPQQSGILKGLGQMFMKLNLKPMMLATSSLVIVIVIVGVGVVLTTPSMRNQPVLATEEISLAPPSPSSGIELSGRAEIAERDDKTSDTQFFTDVDVDLTQEGNEKTGLTFGQSTDLDEAASEPVSPSSPNFVSGGIGTATMADTDEEMEQLSPSPKRLAKPQTSSMRDRLPQPQFAKSNDQFPNATSNPLKVTSENPVSTFSIDVDTASYSWLRSSLSRGQ